jgi:hypothetical protein
MDLQFPSDEMLGLQHVISLTQHSPDLLTLARGDSYPLVIRLEALSDQAMAEGRQLQQVWLALSITSSNQLVEQSIRRC